MATKLYHLGNPTSGAICTSRRTGFVKKYAVPAARFGTAPDALRCARCNETFHGMVKRGMIDRFGNPPITKP